MDRAGSGDRVIAVCLPTQEKVFRPNRAIRNRHSTCDVIAEVLASLVMRTSLAHVALSVTVVTAALMGATSVAAAAPISTTDTGSGAATGSTALGSYEISSPRIDIDGSGQCFDIPMDFAISTSLPEVYWQLKFGVGPAGAVPDNTGYDDGEGSTSRAVSYTYCPNDFRPTNVVTGTVEFTYYADEGTQRASSSFRFEVGVTRAASQTAILKLQRDVNGLVTVTGKVTTTSREFGRVGATGTVNLLVKGPGNRWTKVGEGYASGGLGEFTVYSSKFITKRSTYRLDFVGTDSVAPSKSKTRTG